MTLPAGAAPVAASAAAAAEDVAKRQRSSEDAESCEREGSAARVGREWRCDVNYSARTKDGRINYDALPASDSGEFCGVLLLREGQLDLWASPVSSHDLVDVVSQLAHPVLSHELMLLDAANFSLHVKERDVVQHGVEPEGGAAEKYKNWKYVAQFVKEFNEPIITTEVQARLDNLRKM